jgi:hypothetical protein
MLAHGLFLLESYGLFIHEHAQRRIKPTFVSGNLRKRSEACKRFVFRLGGGVHFGIDRSPTARQGAHGSSVGANQS